MHLLHVTKIELIAVESAFTIDIKLLLDGEEVHQLTRIIVKWVDYYTGRTYR
jgi:hypothetical protein